MCAWRSGGSSNCVPVCGSKVSRARRFSSDILVKRKTTEYRGEASKLQLRFNFKTQDDRAYTRGPNGFMLGFKIMTQSVFSRSMITVRMLHMQGEDGEDDFHSCTSLKSKQRERHRFTPLDPVSSLRRLCPKSLNSQRCEAEAEPQDNRQKVCQSVSLCPPNSRLQSTHIHI